MTGSASKGNGSRYYYYHCAFECRERVRANFSNEKFVEWLKEFQPWKDVKKFWGPLYDDLLQNLALGSQGNQNNIDEEIKKVQQRIENLQDKYADNLIEISDYNSSRQRYVSQLRELNEMKLGMTYKNKDIQEELSFSYPFFGSYRHFIWIHRQT